MITRIRKILAAWLRGLVVTEHEEQTLCWAHSAAPHAKLAAERADLEAAIDGLRRQLAKTAAQDIVADCIVRAIGEPQRYMPDPGLTPLEAQTWEQVLTSQVGIKVDTAMINWTQQQCQAAVATQADDRAYAAGFARGTVVAWQMAKTLSRIVLANQHDPEPDATTADAGLEQHMP